MPRIEGHITSLLFYSFLELSLHEAQNERHAGEDVYVSLPLDLYKIFISTTTKIIFMRPGTENVYSEVLEQI
jgi:hypothetical protein